MSSRTYVIVEVQLSKEAVVDSIYTKIPHSTNLIGEVKFSLLGDDIKSTKCDYTQMEVEGPEAVLGDFLVTNFRLDLSE